MATLDQLVKGAPAPNTSVNDVAAAAVAHPPPTHSALQHPLPHQLIHVDVKSPRAPTLSDPTALLPSAPPQIYLNLLILEASLRSQYLTLRARRRQNTFVLTLLAVWLAVFFYLLWLRPRDDGKGIGGSQYWLVDMLQKVGCITGVVTALLFWATGQWERGVRWPRRWIGVANRGLRGMNAKIVVIRGPWWHELVEWARFVVPFSGGLWGGEQAGSSYHFINVVQEKNHALDSGRPRHRIVEDGKEYAEEDIAPGGDYIKLLLLPKPFTPDFRQNWEMYRTEYWERENERRQELRKRVRARQREIAREEGGIFWWTGWRGWKRARGFSGRSSDVEKSGHSHSHSHSHTHSLSASNSHRRRRPSTLTHGRDGSHSRTSSRSSTPGPDDERRWSSSTAGSTRSTSAPRGKPSIAPGTAASARQPPTRPHLPGSTGSGNRHSTRTSLLSTASSLSELDDGGYEAAAETKPRPQVRRKGSRESGSGSGREAASA